MDEKKRKLPKGVFEKEPGSEIYWIRYADAIGKIRREISGPSVNAALKLYQKRKTEVLQGKKLPETLRARVIKFVELADDAIAYCDSNNLGAQFDGYRIAALKKEFGDRPAELPIEDIRRWFNENEHWKNGTYNRYKTTLSLIYRLAVENKKVTVNPARLLKHKHEDNGRVRFLNQFTPAKTELDYLKPHTDEESRLRAVIEKKYPNHIPDYLIALNTGLRPSEQFSLTWDKVDLTHKLVTVAQSKTGHPRHIPLNSIALEAFQRLFKTSSGNGPAFIASDGDVLKGYKHWFNDAVAEAGIRDFTWYCLRHSFASRLVMAGVDIRTVADLMGHRTIQMTMRYAHLAPEHKFAAVELLAGGKQQEVPTDTRTDTSDFEQVASASEHIN